MRIERIEQIEVDDEMMLIDGVKLEFVEFVRVIRLVVTVLVHREL